MDRIIEVRGLRKEYRGRLGSKVVAIDELDLDIDGPCVYGVLGPNGSGKTTTLRCLLGLVRPSKGIVRVLGADVSQLHTVAHRIGALVEGPKFTDGLSGRENLRGFAQISGVPLGRIDEVLDLVGLTDRGCDRVATYSLGMGQRLGIAAALLNDPRLVILDEPTNGLDPAGIADIRRLVRRFADEGRTVVLSSHQLSEIEQVCDRAIIMHGGRAVVEGPLDELTADSDSPCVHVQVAPRTEALAALIKAGIPASAGDGPDDITAVLSGGFTATDVSRLLAEAGLFPSSLVTETPSLESRFLALTADGAADTAPGVGSGVR